MGLHLFEYRVEVLKELKQVSQALSNIIRVEVRDSTGALIGTLYSNNEGTATITNNPLQSTDLDNNLIRFWSTASQVTIVGAYDNGLYFTLQDVTPTGTFKHLQLDAVNGNRIFKIPFGASNNVETDTGVDLPGGYVVEDCILEVTVVDATETLDVGILSTETGGDANGFMTLASVATAGFVQGEAEVSDGATSDFFAGSNHGVFLASAINGSDAAATSGGYVKKPYICDGTAKSVTYTGSAGSDTAAGYIYLKGYQLPYDANKAPGTA